MKKLSTGFFFCPIHVNHFPCLCLYFSLSSLFHSSLSFQAGIVTESQSKKLIIALEPEAASIWCRQLPPDGFIEENSAQDTIQQNPGTQYIVADCGGMLFCEMYADLFKDS